MSEPRVVYKALRQGKSPYQGFKWPLPTETRVGRWVRMDEAPILCQRGFHGWLSRDRAEAEGSEVYEMEIAGQIVDDGSKVAAQRARLLRLVHKSEPVLVQRGLLPCRRCHEPHNSYRVAEGLAPQWGSLIDGHSYDPVSWEEIAKRLEPAQIIHLAQQLQGEARKAHKGAGTYEPVVPAFHGPFKEWVDGRCGTCGLTKGLHKGWRERAKLADEFTAADRWELLLVIQKLRMAAA